MTSLTTVRKGTHMADPPPYSDPGDEARLAPEGGSSTGTPRWGSVLGITIAIVLVLVFVVLHFTGTLGPGAH